MSLVKVLGKDLSQTDAALGVPGAITGYAASSDARRTVVITITAPLSALANSVPGQGATHDSYAFIPAGCYVQTARLEPDGSGMGSLVVVCVDPGADSQATPAAPTEIFYDVTMAVEQTDLICHPAITASETSVAICLQWLNTPDDKKIDENGYYQYAESDGETFTPVTDALANQFCQAWMHGIKTYNRYFPVVEKSSVYRRPPGLAMSGAQVTGGTLKFSADIGTWSPPDITLEGFDRTGFLKSGDNWRRNANTSWTRTEQWTWTPDGSNSAYGWIYEAAETGGGGAS